jgi:hypothetical protein
MVYFVDWFTKYRKDNLLLKNSLVLKTQCRLTIRGKSNTASVTAYDVRTEALHIVEWIASSMGRPYRVVSSSQIALCVRAIWRSSQYLGASQFSIQLVAILCYCQ